MVGFCYASEEFTIGRLSNIFHCKLEVHPDLWCVFTARCTLVQSAVLRSHVVCLSVCLSVCNVGEL